MQAIRDIVSSWNEDVLYEAWQESEAFEETGFLPDGHIRELAHTRDPQARYAQRTLLYLTISHEVWRAVAVSGMFGRAIAQG